VSARLADADSPIDPPIDLIDPPIDPHRPSHRPSSTVPSTSSTVPSTLIDRQAPALTSAVDRIDRIDRENASRARENGHHVPPGIAHLHHIPASQQVTPMTFAHAIHLADIDRVQVTTGLTAGGEIHVRTSTGTTDIARLTPDMADLLAGALTEVAARARRTTARTPAGHDPADAHGPYQTRGEANQSPAVQAVWKAYSAAPGTGRMAAHCLAILTDACATAGILTGAYDLTVMAWLSGWEPETCQVIAGLITRAARRGQHGYSGAI
jgi:hypothetical protein